MNVTPKQIEYYYTSDGKSPFRKWLDSLRDGKILQVIYARIGRIQVGNMGDCSNVGDGVYELRIHLGPGWRVYFGQVGSKIILLLYGGIKKTQTKDIEKAKIYLSDYRRKTK